MIFTLLKHTNIVTLEVSNLPLIFFIFYSQPLRCRRQAVQAKAEMNDRLEKRLKGRGETSAEVAAETEVKGGGAILLKLIWVQLQRIV